jgi:UDP-N-acetylmuramyl pentapeptide phosphotransferase/UDP-N-acetylglucosamine-1-phosphate transferase
MLAELPVSAALTTGLVIATGVAACLGTRALIPALRRAAVLDRPNERSSHAIPTPRGGGIAVVAASLAAWLGLVAAGSAPVTLLPVIAGAAALALVSWFDDLRGLSPAVRLGAQCAAVALGIAAAMPQGAVFQGWLPAVLDMAAAALLWVWFVNLYNFMDGIDGIAGSETAAIGIGLALFGVTGVWDDPAIAASIVAVPAAAIAAAAIGFLVWNWAPARIFLGDVGSVPLGYLLGYLLLAAAARGHWKIALILPLYFLADATITLLRRLLRGERVWLPHREHFYQQAVRRGLGHAAVVRRVIAADMILIGAGWVAETVSGILGLAAAGATVLVLLASLAGGGVRAYTAPGAAKRGQPGRGYQ